MADDELAQAQAERGACYVYLIHHATSVDTDGNPLIVYVGKSGTAARCRHWRNRNAAVLALGEAGLLRKPVVVASGITLDEAFALEISEIARIGRKDLGLGPLENRCAGGRGVRNPNEGRREAISARSRSPENIAAMQSPQARAKSAASRRGKKMPPEAVEKAAASHRGRKRSAETRANISAARKGKPGRPMSDENRAALLAGSRIMLADPVRKAAKAAKLSAYRTGRALSPEHRAAISATQKGRPNPANAARSLALWADPVWRANVLAKRAAASLARRARAIDVAGEQGDS